MLSTIQSFSTTKVIKQRKEDLKKEDRERLFLPTTAISFILFRKSKLCWVEYIV
jgi:hypothetical protein